MRGPKPPAVVLRPQRRRDVERLARRQPSAQRLVRRRQIVLAAADGLNNEQSARRRGLDRSTVRTWRDRWRTAAPRREAAVAAGDDDRVRAHLLADALDDAPRSGAPVTFSAAQVVQIVAVACEPPPGRHRPTSHWTAREVADEAIKRGIVAASSPRSVERFLGSGRPQAPSESLLAHAQAGRPGRRPRAGDDRV